MATGTRYIPGICAVSPDFHVTLRQSLQTLLQQNAICAGFTIIVGTLWPQKLSENLTGHTAGAWDISDVTQTLETA